MGKTDELGNDVDYIILNYNIGHYYLLYTAWV